MKYGIIIFTAIIIKFSFLTFPDKPGLHNIRNTAEMSVSELLIDNNCTLDGMIPEVIKIGEVDTSEWHGRYDLPDLSYLWEPAKPGVLILNFRKALRDLIGADTDSKELTKRQHDIFAALSDEWRDEAVNSALLLDGRVGTITEMSCLEMMLWGWQDARFPMLEHPTEFSAFVLRRPGQVRVYISSADLVGGKVNKELTGHMQADVKAGFSLITHIHNHPFLFDREVGDRMWTTEANIEDIAGALAPSMSDVGFYRNFRDSFGLKEAWITNGLQSSRFQASEFDTLTAQK